MADTAAIATNGLTKWFGRHRGVEDVSMRVERGEIFGFLGPNGAGKSTTIRLLLGMLRPTAGSASVFGLDAWSARETTHTLMGVLPSEFHFEDALTGREFLDLADGLRGCDSRARRAGLAERLRADLDRPMRELSRGNHQKIGLIHALAHEPELLLLDEPTAGLDPLMQEEFLALLTEERERGTTVMLSSHNLAEAERACDRVAMIHEGRLMAVHDVDELLRRASRRLRIVFSEPFDTATISALPAVRAVKATGNVVEVAFEGDADPVLRAAMAGHVTEVASERPSLEEVFVALYRGVDDDRHADDAAAPAADSEALR